MASSPLRAAVACGVLALAVPTAATAPAGAQVVGCDDSAPLAERLAAAPVVFTGVAEAVTDKGRLATVKVLQIWKGGPLPLRVDVRGSIAEQSQVVTAQERLYAEGRTYLWAPTSGASPHFVENACSPTRSLDAQVNALAPADLTKPGPEAGVALPGEDRTKLLPLALGILGFLGIGALLLKGARRPRAAAR